MLFLVVRPAAARRGSRMEGSGGLGAVSIGISGWLLMLIIAGLVLFGVWKIAKLIWAAFSG